MTAIGKKTTCTFFIYRNKKTRNALYPKSETFCKKQANFRYFFIHKKPDTLSYAIFHEILKLAFIYKNYDTLCYVRFLYTKSQKFRKKQDNLCCVSIYKNPDTLRYAVFHWIFEIGGRRGIFIYKKQCNLRYIFICKQKYTLRYVLHTKFLSLCVNF